MLKNVRTFIIISVFFAHFINGCAEDKASLQQKSLLYLKLGVSHFRENDNTAALKELMKAKDLNPDDPQVYNVIGLVYLKKKDYSSAKENFNRALAINPSLSGVHNNLGTLYLELRQWEDAIGEFKKALSNPLYATPERALCNIGWAYYRMGDIGKAIESYNKALDISPDFYLAHYNLGIGYSSIDKVNEAIDEFRLSIHSNPEFADAHYQLGLIYFKMGRKDEARKRFKEVLRIAPRNETRKAAQRYLDILN
ncbi:MAG: tetratricopeptide repeat protein [Thermodesulfobacteriota bacterium]|nr:tetratricopeptide repeat protein [Thermodesulfobacteriota bacterium]